MSADRRQARPRRRAWRRRLLLALALGSLALILASLLAGPLLKRRIEAALSAATGLSASIGSLRLSLKGPLVRLEGLVLRDGERELLRLATARLRLDVRALVGGRFVAPELDLGGLRLDLREPWPVAPSSEGGGAAAPTLTVARLRLHDARVLLRGPVEALALDARGSLLGDTFRLDELVADAGPGGRAVLDGKLRLFGAPEPELDLHVDWTGEAAALLELLAPSAPVSASGQAAASLEIRGPTSELEIEGEASLDHLAAEAGAELSAVELSPRLLLSGSRWTLESGFRARQARLRPPGLEEPLTLGDLEGQLEADSEGALEGLLDGALAGGRLELEATGSRSELGLRLRVDGARLEQLPGVGGLPPLAGELVLAASAHGPALEPQAMAVELSLSIEPLPEAVPGALSGKASVTARWQDGVLRIEPSELELAGARLRLEGSLPSDAEAELSLSLTASSLSRTTRSLAPFVPALAEASRRLTGELRFDGRAAGPLESLRLSGPLDLRGLGIDGTRAGRLRAELGLDAQAATLDALSLEGDWGRAEGRAHVPLADPAATEAELRLDGLSLELLAALAGLDLELAGAASGSLDIAAGEAVLALEAKPLRVAGIAFDAAGLEATLRDGVLELARLEASSPAGGLSASGRLPLDPEAEGRLEFRLEGVRVETELAGEPLVLRADARGELGGRLLEGRPTGGGSFALGEASWGGRPLPGQTGRFELDGERLSLQLEEGLAVGTARLDLVEPFGLAAELDVPGRDWAEVLPEPPEVLRVGDSRLLVSGRLGQPRLELQCEGLSVKAGGVLVESVEPVRSSFEEGRLELPPTRVTIAGREASVEATVLAGEPPRIEASLKGELDLGELLVASTGAAHAAGTARVDLRISGPPEALALRGTAEAEGVALRSPSLPASIEDGRAGLRFDGERIIVESLEATMGGGRLRGSGELAWSGNAPGRHRLVLSGSDVSLRGPDGFSGLASFELELTGELEASTLAGELRLESGRYVKDLHLERSLATRIRAPAGARQRGPLDRVRLDLRVRSENDLIVRNDLATAKLGADLEVSGTAARPLLTGLAEARPGGVVRFQRVSYRLLDGLLAFGPSHPNDPELQILAETTVGEYQVTLEVGGRLSDPRIELSSTPELPQERLVALLLSGGLVGAPGGGPPSSVGEVAPGLAQDYLAGRLDPLERRAREALRLDVVEIDPVLVGGADARGARLTLGKALTDRLYLAQSILVGGAGDTTTELRLKLSEHLSLREVHEWDGGNSVEARWSRSFGPASKAAASAEKSADGLRVAGLALEGAPADPGEVAVREALELEPGAPAAEADLWRAAERARQRLVESGRYLARVRCSAAEPQDGERKVSCSVDAGPRLELEILGLDDKKKRRSIERAVERRWSELLRGEDPATAAREAALERLADDGRLHARVSVEEAEGGEDRRLLRLTVEAGPVVRLGDIELEGVAELDEKKVRAAARAAAGGGLFAPRVRPELPEEAARAVEAVYRRAGYLHVAAQGSLDAPTGGERALLRLEVEEGPLVLLRSWRIEGALPSPEERWEKAEGIVEGEPVNPAALDALADRMVGAFDAEGHPDAAVDWLVLPVEEGLADALVSTTPGPRVAIGSITVEGLARTDEDFVRRTLELEEGEPFSRQGLLEARRRLRSTGLFSSVVVRATTKDAASSTRPILVRLRERDHVELSLGAGWDSDDGPLGTLSVSNRNLDGRGRSAALHLRLTGADSLVEARFGWQRFAGSPWTLQETLRVQREEEDGLVVRRTGLRTGFSRDLGSSWRLDLHHLLDRVDVVDVDLGDYEEGLDEGRLSEIGAGIVWDGRDDAARTQAGSLSSVSLRVASSLLGSELEQFVVEAQQAFWRPLSKRGLLFVSSWRLGAGWPLGSADRLSLAERFRVGGVGSVRGYRMGHAGPLDPLTGDPVGGDAQLVLRNEFRLPLGGPLTGIVFADGGRGFDSIDELSRFDLFWSLGAGFGIDTPAGPIRLLYGFALNPEPGEPDGRFHFSFGSSF